MMDYFYNVPLYEENNKQHSLTIAVTLESDTMELTCCDLTPDDDGPIIESATFDAKEVRQLYRSANNSELIVRLVMDFCVDCKGAATYDELINHLHENGIREIG